MTKQSNRNRRNGKKQKLGAKPPHPLSSAAYVREIIKRLTQVSTISGYGPAVIFNDWTQLVQASLEALPTHLKAIASTGRWAEDTPEAAQTFAHIRARYDQGDHHPTPQRVWECFGQAFAWLLESAAPGLWAFDPSTLRRRSGEPSLRTGDPSGSAGPDVLGQIFMEYTQPDPHKGQYLTPWPVVLMMSQLNSGGKELVYDRLKQACQHPDNLLAHATLLAGLAIEDPAQARDWFITRVVPAALPHFEIVKVCDPCVGSGRMLLGMATQFEPWMVQLGLVQFFGQDLDPLLARLCKINCALYGLNTYALKLAEAVQEMMTVRQADHQSTHLSLPHSPQAALEQAVRLYQPEQAAPKGACPTFEELFKVTR